MNSLRAAATELLADASMPTVKMVLRVLLDADGPSAIPKADIQRGRCRVHPAISGRVAGKEGWCADS
jgi:hypothetical protein